MNKKIVLNHVFAGSYWQDNLGHEVINFFKADDGCFYFYVCPYGYANKDRHCVPLNEGDLIVNLMTINKDTAKVLSIGVVEKDLVSQYRPKYNKDSRKLTCEEPEGEKNLQSLKKSQEELNTSITYDGKPMGGFFVDDTLPLFNVTAKMKDVYLWDEEKDLTIKLGEMPLSYRKISPKQDRKEFFGKSWANQYVSDDPKMVKCFEDLLKKDGFKEKHGLKDADWKRALRAYDDTPNFLRLSGRMNDENAISNLIASFCELSQEAKKAFGQFAGVNVPYVLKRERHMKSNHGRPDFTLLANGKMVAMVENKVEAELTSDKKFGNQIPKYLDELPKSGHLIVLVPDYYDAKKIDAMAVKDCRIVIKRYSDLISDVFTELLSDLPSSYKDLYDQFRDVLEIHSQNTNNDFYNTLMSRYNHIVNS
jgi:hypothetical protein